MTKTTLTLGLAGAAVILSGAALVMQLAPGAAPEAAAPTMSDAARMQFRSEVRSYLIENPEVLVEAIDELNRRQEQVQAQATAALVDANRAEIFEDPDSWVGGNPDGDVTVVEFMDYRCGYCRRVSADVDELVASDGNIRFVLKEFPILSEDSATAARLAIATLLEAGDDAYKAMHDTLMAHDGGYDPVTLTRLAEGLGLEAAPILARMEDDEVGRIIGENHALVQELGISPATPTFFFNDTMVSGARTLDQMRAIVAAERQG